MAKTDIVLAPTEGQTPLGENDENGVQHGYAFKLRVGSAVKSEQRILRMAGTQPR